MTKEISVTDLKPGMEACLPRWGWVRIKGVDEPLVLVHHEGGQVYVAASSMVPVAEVDAS